MRLLCILNDETKTKELSHYLTSYGIDNQADIEVKPRLGQRGLWNDRWQNLDRG